MGSALPVDVSAASFEPCAHVQGVGDASNIDMGMKLGTNQPMGPLQLADFIGNMACSVVGPSALSMALINASWRILPAHAWLT